MDYIQVVDDSFLQRLALSKGGWMECDSQDFNQVLNQAEKFKPPLMMPGGSACNTMKGLAALGVPTAITGCVGNDSVGNMVLSTIEKLGITPLFKRCHRSTSQVASLVTPDGERTFCVFVETEKEISSKDLKPSFFQGVDIVHVEGYRLPNDIYVETAMKMAKDAGALVTFDLCNPVYAEKYRERIYGLLNEYVDILFLDRDEAYALTHFEPERACDFLKNYCNLAIVKVGSEGCWIGENGAVTHYPTTPKQMTDSTGAGDLFAAGFLYGILNHEPLANCVQYAHLLGGTVIENFGAEIPNEMWADLRQKICSTK